MVQVLKEFSQYIPNKLIKLKLLEKGEFVEQSFTISEDFQKRPQELKKVTNNYFLIAYKKLGVNGTDYLGVRNEEFSISSFELFDVDSEQDILSAGFSYNFNKKTTFLINFQRIGYNNELHSSSFRFNQFFALLQLRF